MQDEIVAILEGEEGIAEDLQNPRYNKIANPFALEYQNSNGWILNVMVAAESGVRTQQDALRYCEGTGHRPSQVRVSWWRSLGSFVESIFVSSNAHLEDHPGDGDRWFDFVSAESLYSWLEGQGRLLAREDFCHPAGCNIPLTTLNRFDN